MDGALAGGAALGRYGVPIVLTRPTLLEAPARGVLEAHADTIEDVFFLGWREHDEPARILNCTALFAAPAAALSSGVSTCTRAGPSSA